MLNLRIDNDTVALCADGSFWSDIAVLQERRSTPSADDLIRVVSVYRVPERRAMRH